MLILPIQHAIGVLSPPRASRVLSKDQALKQCTAYLQTHYPQAQQVEMSSTSAAMQLIMTDRLQDAAAIGALRRCSNTACILDRDIGNVRE